jgi:hypothetical protein
VCVNCNHSDRSHGSLFVHTSTLQNPRTARKDGAINFLLLVSRFSCPQLCDSGAIVLLLCSGAIRWPPLLLGSKTTTAPTSHASWSLPQETHSSLPIVSSTLSFSAPGPDTTGSTTLIDTYRYSLPTVNLQHKLQYTAASDPSPRCLFGI